ncbi:uncharacterized protein LOC142982077 [Anticarsia gemmatalis]|uniref:uncharacterized protein LOC142982077 n=1 Tax=Anticarsia gemmatalis TaxID=129554 RepID=UPI003F76DBE3
MFKVSEFRLLNVVLIQRLVITDISFTSNFCTNYIFVYLPRSCYFRLFDSFRNYLHIERNSTKLNMQIRRYNPQELIDTPWLEELLLQFGDVFEIRIVWNRDTALLSSILAVAGGLLGGLAGGRVGAALGAGIGGAAGLGVATVVSLREVWESVKEKLKEVLFIILNFLRSLEPHDYVRAVEILMACATSRRELVMTIIEFIAQKLSADVLSNIGNCQQTRSITYQRSFQRSNQ